MGTSLLVQIFFSPQTVVQFLLLKRDDMGKSSSFAIEIGSL